MTTGCLACDLIEGHRSLPGGRIFETEHWVLEHCMGPLGVGTLLLKPFRHCLGVGELSAAESSELGPLLRTACRCVQELNEAEQVYVCLWSHAGWEPVHIHFVLQPAWKSQSETYPHPGPTMQSAMFVAGEQPDLAGLEAFAERARSWMARERPDAG